MIPETRARSSALIEGVQKGMRKSIPISAPIGSAIPDFTYGITLNASWKGLDLTIFGAGSQGNDVFVGWDRTSRMKANNLAEFYNGRWTQAGDQAEYARANPSNYDKYLKSSKYVFDGSYFKIKQIQLGYTLPQNLLKKVYLSNLRLYCSLEDFQAVFFAYFYILIV